MRRIVEAIADGAPARSFKEELLAIEQQQAELERETARAPEPQPPPHPNLADLYQQKAAALHTALEDPSPSKLGCYYCQGVSPRCPSQVG